jgi:pimeloyl-ACP methyl ester carboxylesterase
MSIESFAIPFFETEMADLRERLGRTRWPDEIAGTAWEYGADLGYTKEICRYWREEYDWERQLKLLSSLHHYRYTKDGFGIHFIHERGNGTSPIPLILTHGWPGSFVEMLRIIPILTETFDVVVPSLPGFGFSDRPNARGSNSLRVADLWADLMKALGYERFVAQGGDIGAGVSTVLALRYPARIIGLHLNFIPTWALKSPVEGQFAKSLAQWHEENGAYSHIQRTRPLTAAYGLNDSPAGLAAWILEKFCEWSDWHGDFFKTFSRDDLLTNVTLYWMTETIHSSFRMYLENRKAPLQFASDDFVKPPCAIAHFPKEILFPPREFVERSYNIRHWTEMPRGGHFAAMEQPELLARDIRTCFLDHYS